MRRFWSQSTLAAQPSASSTTSAPRRCVAVLVRNRDPFGAAIGLWFVGVSLLDVAPYMYDARDPQLMLLTGTTGENGPHDWIYLFSSLGWLARRLNSTFNALRLRSAALKPD